MSLEKKYFALRLRRKLGKKEFLKSCIVLLRAELTAPFMPAEWAGQPVLLSWQLERPICDFKNYFSPAFVYIHIAKYVFSRDMFCLPYF